MAIFILRTHYPSGQLRQTFCSSSGLCIFRSERPNTYTIHCVTVAIFILRTHYPSGQLYNRQTFCSSSGLCVSSIKTGARHVMRPGELPFVARRSRLISKESGSRRIMRLAPVFILETHNQMNYNYKCLAKFVKSDNASSSIKTAIDALSVWTHKASSGVKTADVKFTLRRSIENKWICCQKSSIKWGCRSLLRELQFTMKQ